jgi:membrane glycosyltransferase
MIDNEQPDDRRIEPPGKRLRRLLFACLVVGTTAFASVLMLDIVGASGVTVLETAILLLFVPTFGWISVPLWNAVFGFLLTVLGRDPLTLQPTVRRPSAGRSPIRSRTALVIPADLRHRGRDGAIAGGHGSRRTLRRPPSE